MSAEFICDEEAARVDLLIASAAFKERDLPDQLFRGVAGGYLFISLPISHACVRRLASSSCSNGQP
jgi:hypothetical protein